MSVAIRIILLIGAVCMFFYVLKGVTKAKFRAQETFFWLFLSVVFVLLSIVPGVAEWFSRLLGVMTPVNLVFLVVIFLLLLKVFAMDRKIAKTEHQLTQMAQKIAISELNKQTEQNEQEL